MNQINNLKKFIENKEEKEKALKEIHEILERLIKEKTIKISLN